MLLQTYSLEIPNSCPYCHVANSPTKLWGQESRDIDDINITFASWTCGNIKCRRVFITQHRLDEDEKEWKLSGFLNGFPKGPDWPTPILELKCGISSNLNEKPDSKFIKTYLQSLVAENKGLDELSGMGYRKSIEYLVKDWAISIYPEKKDEIFHNWLAYVIENFFQGDLKEILQRATWLGNDQSHYNQVFQDYNINDLKELIALIMVDLDREHKKKQYITNIQKRK